MNNNIEGPTNKEPIKQMFSKLSNQTHPSPEMVLAYARGVLSQDGRSKIAIHIKDCKECAEILTIAKESLQTEKDFVSQGVKFKHVVPLSPEITARFKLATLLNLKKDELVEKVAKILLPKESWDSIRSTIVISKSQHKDVPRSYKKSTDELPIAAFSSGAGVKGKQDYEVVIKIINFINLIRDLLLNQCKKQNDIESKLPICVDDAIEMLDDRRLYEEAKSKILKVLSESLPIDERDI